MDSNLIQVAISQQVQQVEKKLMPLEIINVETAKKALSGKFIGQASEDEVKSKLKIIYAMIGLRPQHFPVDEEKQFLHDYIFLKYGKKTLDELVLAFDLAIQGQLPVEDIKVYDQFTCEYLARIMNGYREWLKNVSANAEVQKKDYVQIEEKKELTKEELEEWLEEWKGKETFTLDLIPLSFYEFIVSNGLIEIDNKTKWDYTEKATTAIKVELHEAMNVCKTNNAYNDFRAFEKGQQEGFEGAMKGRILNKAKRLIIADYLKFCHAK